MTEIKIKNVNTIGRSSHHSGEIEVFQAIIEYENITYIVYFSEREWEEEEEEWYQIDKIFDIEFSAKHSGSVNIIDTDTLDNDLILENIKDYMKQYSNKIYFSQFKNNYDRIKEILYRNYIEAEHSDVFMELANCPERFRQAKMLMRVYDVIVEYMHYRPKIKELKSFYAVITFSDENHDITDIKISR